MLMQTGRAPSESHAFVRRVARRLDSVCFWNGSNAVPIALSYGYAFAPSDAQTRRDLVAVCRNRCKASRERAGAPVGSDVQEVYELRGSFEGIEEIVEGVLCNDPWTRAHLLHVNMLVDEWSAYNLEFSASERALLQQASLLHDVGKVLIPDKILLKPSALTSEEYRVIQRHAEYGRHILSPHAGYTEVAEIVGQHHESWDGRGYPEGLEREQIHPIARAISVVDAFSAMVIDRSYHCAISRAEALEELELCAGTQFDPYFVERFTAYCRRPVE